MKSKIIKVVSTVVVVCLIGGGGYYFYNKAAKAKAATNNTNRYYTVAAQKSNLDVTVSATGTVEAAQTKDVVANNSGIVQNLNVKVGDTVKEGDTIAKVQSDDIDAAVNKSNLTVQQQQLQVNNAKNANDQAMQELSLQSAQNDLNNKIEQQNKMTLTAPIGGVVVAKNDNNGDNVQAGKALITIADLSSMKIDVQVDELDISKVKTGQTADIKFDAISGKTYTGTVDSISQMGTTSNNVTTYDVIVIINNPDGVKIGMNGNVNIKVTSKADALTIPVEALIERNNKKYVMVKTNSSTTESQGSWSRNSNSGNSNSSYRRNSSSGTNSGSGRVSTLGGKLVEVETGLENETTVEITSGIKEGDQVMIQLPQSTSTSSQKGSFGGLGGGSFGGLSGGNRQSGSSNKNSSQNENNGGNSSNTSNSNSSNNGSTGNNGTGNSGAGK